MVFFGEYYISLTTGNRLALPKKIRDQLENHTFILTKGFDFCLSGYKTQDWEKKAKELMSASLLDKTDLKKKRIIFSSAVYLEFDKQGRFIIPKNLLEFAEINKDVVIIGVGDHFEIWSKEKWEVYQNQIDNE
ncbi:MAG: transcriptional regulator MraZ [Patescibacteria group bacterium]|nr:MAG: transcriptional regulator MraZ [Patescibacteria group bacterium]